VKPFLETEKIMATPEIKIICLSNVYTRLMYFKKAGDTEHGHEHVYDHATLVSSGSVLCELLDDNYVTESSKQFDAPALIFIKKLRKHKLTALTDNTTLACVHALRTESGDIVSPEFIVDEHDVTQHGMGRLHSISIEVSNKCLQSVVDPIVYSSKP